MYSQEKKFDLIDGAAAMLSQGKTGVTGIIKNPSKSEIKLFSQPGSANIVFLKLELFIGPKQIVLDSSTFEGRIIFGEAKNDRSAWFVITDNDWNYIASSLDDATFFHLIAFADTKTYSRNGVQYTGNIDEDVPLAINVCFDNITPGHEVMASAMLQDRNLATLWYYEAQKMICPTVRDIHAESMEEEGLRHEVGFTIGSNSRKFESGD